MAPRPIPIQTYQAIRSMFDCWRTLKPLSLAPSFLAGTAAVFHHNRKLCSHSPKRTSSHTEDCFCIKCFILLGLFFSCPVLVSLKWAKSSAHNKPIFYYYHWEFFNIHDFSRYVFFHLNLPPNQ